MKITKIFELPPPSFGFDSGFGGSDYCMSFLKTNEHLKVGPRQLNTEPKGPAAPQEIAGLIKGLLTIGFP